VLLYIYLAYYLDSDYTFRFLNTIETALAFGDVILIENLKETVDPVLGPLLGRNTTKKGKYVLCCFLKLCLVPSELLLSLVLGLIYRHHPLASTW
jgi:hypothetical protein